MRHFDYVLFIDDDYATNYYHEVIAKDSGMVKEVKNFLSSKEALQYFEEGKFNKSSIPEVIFLDMNMPELNGLEFLDHFEKIKMDQYPKIILLSTTINPKDKQKADNHPLILEFINKPLTIEYLVRLNSRLKAS